MSIVKRTKRLHESADGLTRRALVLVAVLGFSSLVVFSARAASETVPRSTLLRWSGADTPVALLEVPELQCVGLPRDESQLELARTALDAISPGRVSPVIWGYGEAIVWCRLSVVNAEEQPQELRWDFRYAFYDFIRFYVSRNQETPVLAAAMGDSKPFSERLISSTGFEFPFTLA